MQAPIAKKEPLTLEKHGHKRIDPYFWMHERDHEDVVNYLNEENAYTAHYLKDTESQQEGLFQEMKARIKEDDQSVPYRLQDYLYYTRYETGGQHPIFCRKKEEDSEEEILLNVNEMAEGHNYYKVNSLKVSANQQLIAFAVDTQGRRINTIHFKDLKTGEILEEHIPDCTGSMAWARDNKHLFYTKQDPQTLRPYQVFRHELSQDIAQDVKVFEEPDEKFYLYVYTSKSKEFVQIGLSSTLTTETWYVDANKPLEEFKVVCPRTAGHEYGVEAYKGDFYIITNDNAKNFRLMKSSIENSQDKSQWKEIIPHREDVLLESIEVFQNYLVLDERSKGLTRLRVLDWGLENEHYIQFQDPTYTVGLGMNPEFATDIIRFNYQSLTTPASVYDYNMEDRNSVLLKQTEVLGDFKTDDLKSERIWATAADGTKVPISLVYKKGALDNGPAPTYLTAYGAYGISYDPYFSSVRLSLLNRGFVFAIAHIRGGEDMGRAWYEDGRQFKKKNTFTDFIACAEHLKAEKYTHEDQLCVNGGSAGGLLMGAVVNMRPDLFKIVVADVPFVDVISTMLDDSIPLTVGEYDEWGNPNEKEVYDYILEYSPYDQVKEQEYPYMMVTSGYHDSQVQYWEPTKWVAKLRTHNQSDNPILLYTNMEAGHSGKSGRFEQLKEVAREYAFILKTLQINF